MENSPLTPPRSILIIERMSHENHRRNKSKQRKPRSLADIVREKTNDGEVIVDFYLDVVRGKLDDEVFEVCHRLEAAEQVHAIAPGLVAEYIAQLTGLECNHVIRHKRTRPTTVVPAEAGTHPRPDSNNANSTRTRHQALEYLASALAAPSLADDPRVAGQVRESTDHGKTVVSFLLHVMHGVVRGFKPLHRVQAASELLGHIARDELAQAEFARTPFIPADAGIQIGGDRVGLPSNAVPTEPALSAPTSSFPRRREPIPGPSATSPQSVRPEPVEEPALSLPKGQFSGSAVVERSSDSQRGSYDIDRKIAEAQRDLSHPIHKFVQAYDEVAAAFHGKDKENDEDDEVRYWISGEVRDAYGKYIWEYAPADPRSSRRLRAKRRRSKPKGESVWVKSEIDKRREAGIPPPKRTLMWI